MGWVLCRALSMLYFPYIRTKHPAMQLKISSASFLILLSLFSFSQESTKTIMLPGYLGDIRGEILQYHSPHPEATTSLLVRNEDDQKFIEWTVPGLSPDKEADSIIYIWLFGIDVNEEHFSYDLYFNDQKIVSFDNPQDTLNKDLIFPGDHGSSLLLKPTMVDKYGDLMGYAFLKIPSRILVGGEDQKIRIMGNSAGSRCWYMTFRYTLRSAISLHQEQALVVSSSGQPSYLLRIDVHHFGEPLTADITIGGEKHKRTANLGLNQYYFDIDTSQRRNPIPVSITLDGKVAFEDYFTAEPVGQFDMYLIHHSHNDIGYTHVQDEVERMQHGFLKQAIQLGKETTAYPEDSRFVWNTEVMWAVDSFLEQAGEKEKEEFFTALREGWICLDGMYANELTALCTQEELMQLFEAARRIGRESGVPVRSAMISDIPGNTWGLINAMGRSGIRYFSSGTNNGHRTGNINEALWDKPFYWVSQDEQDTVLTWFCGKGYSWFHTGLGYQHLINLLEKEKILEHIKALRQSGYPYDIKYFRYNIGSDNGPPDPNISATVKAWNERFISPRIIISSVSKAFSAFEDKYGRQLPVLKGDLTPMWEDGAASSARETAMNRASANRITQAGTLYSMICPEKFPPTLQREAWKNVMLYDEHTWGSWNSISEPFSPFTLQQWENKRQYALNADSLSRRLLAEAKGQMHMSEQDKDGTIYISIANTLSWDRQEIVIIPFHMLPENPEVFTSTGEIVETQLLSNGDLAMKADVTALGSTEYLIKSGKRKRSSSFPPDPLNLENGVLKINIDLFSGAIRELVYGNNNYVDANHPEIPGLNTLVYIRGRDPEDWLIPSKCTIHWKEYGPLVKVIEIRSETPVAGKLIQEIRLDHQGEYVEISNILDKTGILYPEAVFFAFPFHIPDGNASIDIAFGDYTPGVEQLPGSNMNYFTLQRWVDISNKYRGITLISKDAPMIQTGEILTDAIVTGWKKEPAKGQTVYSYVMNNYWETNYKASQEGETIFRYRLFPHEGPLDALSCEKEARAFAQPLLVMKTQQGEGKRENLISLDNPQLMITAVRPVNQDGRLMVDIYNPSGSSLECRILPGTFSFSQIMECDPDGWPVKPMEESFILKPKSLRSCLLIK